MQQCRHFLSQPMILVAAVMAVVLSAALAVVLIRNSPGRPPGLIQAGNSKTDCIYVKLGSPLRQVEQETGVDYNCILTYSNADPTWSDWVSPWVTRDGAGYKSWLAVNPTMRQIILTLDLIPDSVASDPKWTAKCAAGDYDTYARELATNLVDTGFGYSVIRLGAETNGTWNIGSLGPALAEWHQWGECFAREVRVMRAVHGSHLLFDWNVNANYRNIPLGDFYPGNAYVDIIGIDAYDESGIPLPPVESLRRWAVLTSEPDGLDAVEAFAAAHRKPLSIPEWATVVSQGDDANYVSSMGLFIATHDVAYQSWFDAANKGIFQLSRTRAPLSLAAYKNAFG